MPLLNSPMPTVLNTKLDRHSDLISTDRLSLTAEERQRSRCPFTTLGNVEVYLQLERGLFLREGDKLQSVDGSLVVEIVAKPEWVMAVKSERSIDLLQAAIIWAIAMCRWRLRKVIYICCRMQFCRIYFSIGV